MSKFCVSANPSSKRSWLTKPNQHFVFCDFESDTKGHYVTSARLTPCTNSYLPVYTSTEIAIFGLHRMQCQGHAAPKEKLVVCSFILFWDDCSCYTVMQDDIMLQVVRLQFEIRFAECIFLDCCRLQIPDDDFTYHKHCLWSKVPERNSDSRLKDVMDRQQFQKLMTHITWGRHYSRPCFELFCTTCQIHDDQRSRWSEIIADMTNMARTYWETSGSRDQP